METVKRGESRALNPSFFSCSSDGATKKPFPFPTSLPCPFSRLYPPLVDPPKQVRVLAAVETAVIARYDDFSIFFEVPGISKSPRILARPSRVH